jgi:hypothetical protein
MAYPDGSIRSPDPLRYPTRPRVAPDARHRVPASRPDERLPLLRRPPEPLPQVDLPQRSYRIACITAAGQSFEAVHSAPAALPLEDICAAFARGTLIATPQGPVAVEDLAPGDPVLTRDEGPQPLRWIGACAVTTSDADFAEGRGPLRVMIDALGEGRPAPDLVLHHRARILVRHSACRSRFGTDAALAPVRAFADGDRIAALRPAEPVQFYNLALDRHQILTANGIEVESYHPGTEVAASIGGELHHHLIRLFPFLGGRLDGFGPLCRPRLRAVEAEALSGI